MLPVMDWVLRLNYYYELAFSNYKNFVANPKYTESKIYDAALKEFVKKTKDLLRVGDYDLEVKLGDNGTVSVIAPVALGEYVSIFNLEDERESGLYDKSILLYRSDVKPFDFIQLSNDKQLKETPIDSYICKHITAMYQAAKKAIEADEAELQRLSKINREHYNIIDKCMSDIREKLSKKC